MVFHAVLPFVNVTVARSNGVVVVPPDVHVYVNAEAVASMPVAVDVGGIQVHDGGHPVVGEQARLLQGHQSSLRRVRVVQARPVVGFIVAEHSGDFLSKDAGVVVAVAKGEEHAARPFGAERFQLLGGKRTAALTRGGIDLLKYLGPSHSSDSAVSLAVVGEKLPGFGRKRIDHWFCSSGGAS